MRCPLTPVPNVTLLFERDGKEVARVKTGPHGRYQLEVSPGSYLVSTVPGSPAFTKVPFEVHTWKADLPCLLPTSYLRRTHLRGEFLRPSP
ncbi:MAG: hypothetical protein M3O70_24990 [Actinomycetota bacterium]|nr:hypothetical protein [Actinomycetota bacterium]